MGTVVISVDAELGWGFHDTHPPADRVENARSGWRKLAALLEEYAIPATWGIVGHLLLDSCDGHHRDHPAAPAWFTREHGAWADRPDLRFGRGLVERLQTSPLDHDIGCHTFSHVLFGDARTTPEIARAELERALELAQRHDIHHRSFIFPRNMVGYRDLLAEYGFETYRGVAPDKPGFLRKLAAGTVTTPKPRLVAPSVDEYGLVNIPASLFLFAFEGLPRRLLTSVFEDPIVQRARRGIDAACASDGVFHMWLHPNNLVTADDAQRLEAILSYLASRRGDLTISTMAAVAARHQQRPAQEV